MELRKIVFEPAEIQAAVVSQCLHSGMSMPDANIVGLDIADEAEATVTLRFDPSNPSDPKTMALGREKVAAALIRHCMENDIPLPRAAQKVLVRDDAGLALLINVHYVRKEKAAEADES